MQHAKHIPHPQPVQKLEYPSLFHFRIITDTEVQAEKALLQAVSTYDVKAPLASTRASAAGRFTAFSISILMQSRLEMETFDAAIKKVPGVRMVL